MLKSDFIGVVEAAYHLDGDDQDWLQSVAQAVTPLLGKEYGVTGFSYDVSDPTGPKLGTFVSTGPHKILEAIKETMSQAPEDGTKASLIGTPGVYTFFERIRSEDRKVFERIFTPLTEEFGISMLGDGILASEPSGLGVTMFGFTSNPEARTAQEKARWAKATVHIATALRLRRAFQTSSEVEAILSPDGKCEHAEEGAKSRSSRDALRDAVKAIDKARGRERLRDQDRALAIWKGLCSGRWSLVDRFESDGRRYVVAFRNDPRLKDPRALTAREMQVAAYAALGHSNKLMAYALGLSSSTVAWHMARAMQKLGASSRAELVRLFSAFGRGAAPQGSAISNIFQRSASVRRPNLATVSTDCDSNQGS
jgi:DNA-binding CsgD family transcriptional regulator